MLNSLFASSSGLRVHQEMLDVVGNNLANVNTPGYKTQQIRFADVQAGLGVKVASIDSNFTQASTEATGNKLDLAIQDNGFFLLRNNKDFLATRAGTFSIDRQNYLVDTSTGNRVQRVGTVGEGSATTPAFQIQGNNDISVRNGMTIPGKATTQITFKGNLDSRADLPQATVLTGQTLTAGGQPATADTLLNNLDQTIAPYVAGDRIQIQGSRVDGSTVNASYTATGTNSDTVGSLLGVINSAYLASTPGVGASASLDDTGRIVLTANQAGVSKLTLSITSDAGDAAATSGVTNFANFDRTVEGRDGGTATTAMEIFDGQFASRSVQFTFQRQSYNTWSLNASIDGGTGTTTRYGEDNTVTGLKFNVDGSLAGIDGTATAQTVAMNSPLTAGQAPATLATSLDQLDQHNLGAYAPTDVLTIAGTERDGRAIAPVSFSPAGKTVGDLLNSINSAFHSAVASLDESGNIQLTSSTTGQSELSLQLKDGATNAGQTAFGNFTEAVRGTNGDDAITFQFGNGSGFGSDQTIQLSFGSQKGFDGLTQFGGFNSAVPTSQDGVAQGTLVDESVRKDGTIMGQFSNGQSQALAQIAIATFANPQGLQRVGNNAFALNPNSGPPVITTAQAGEAGSIQSGVLEASNVDIGVEFTALITAQRGFQVNARAFSIENQILEETANLLH